MHFDEELCPPQNGGCIWNNRGTRGFVLIVREECGFSRSFLNDDRMLVPNELTDVLRNQRDAGLARECFFHHSNHWHEDS